MPEATQALTKIAAALEKLNEARAEVSKALIGHRSGSKGDDRRYQELSDLHRRITQAITALPHGGRNL